MKNLFILFLSFFACLSGFAQGVAKRFFEDNPKLGGDAILKSSSVKVEKEEISKIFEIESPAAGAYYTDAWILVPVTKDGYPEYQVAVNGVLTGYTFKPQSDDWHSLALTDVKKSAAAVNLKKGVNTISVIGKGPEIPAVEFIKLSSNLSRTGISDSKYREFIESAKNNTLNDLINSDLVQMISNRGTNGEIYNYYLNIPYVYTTCLSFNFYSGQNVSISIQGVNPSAISNTMIEFFSITNPESYSWRSLVSNGIGSLNVTIPAAGAYILCLHIPPTNYPQTLPWALSGLVNITVNNQLYGNCIVTNSILTAVSGGYPTPANFFTCKLKGGGDTWLLLEDNSGKIRAFNDDGGTTSDGYSWGNASRITTYLTNISAGYVFSYSSNNPVLECDLYMGLAAPTSNIFGTDIYGNGIKFPELNLNNSFVSAPAGNYFCYHWSVGIDYIGPNDDWWIYPTLSPDSIYLWDKFYESYGYTNVGATADNAAIALWMGKYWSIIDADSLNTISHASVRKNSVIPKPHGFEWESKMGGAERIMHTRDAVGGSIYGSIIRYYRPISGTVNYSPPAISAKQKSSFSASDLNRVATLKNQIPVAVLSGFEEKYLAWEKTWSRPEIVIHSNPYRYAESTEYKDLLEYGLKYGKAIWPLLFEKLTPKDIFIVNLLKDLTYGGKRSFGNDITPVPEKGKPLPSAYSILVDYCKGLLAKEEGNMQNAIRNISAAEEGNLEVNISVNDREILLNLSSIIDDKASVTIYNVFGGVEYNASYSLSKGNQTLAINASNFKKGIYIVQITMGGKTISQTISI